MKIDWSQADLSNHETIALGALVSRMGEIGQFNPVLPARGGERIIELDRGHTPSGYWASARPMIDLDNNPRMKIDYERDRCFAIDYQYRSASNYKTSGCAVLRGILDPLRHALLLTILGGSEDGYFIPSQLELEDLQKSGGWSLDFTHEDHVWHQLEAISPVSDRPDALDIDRVLMLGRTVMKDGWDDIGTISELMGGSD